MKRDKLYIDFAIKILKIIDKDDLNNPGAMNRVKIYYARTPQETIVDEINDFCMFNNTMYTYELKDGKYFASFWNTQVDWPKQNVVAQTSSEELLDALVIGVLKVYDKIIEDTK